MKDGHKKKELSIIIACLNEEDILEKNVEKVESVLKRSSYDWEIIFVNDGSTDRTHKIIQSIVKNKRNMSYIFHKKNMGRGKAVEDGLKLAKGEICGFIDIDLEISPQYIIILASEINKGWDITTGSRIYKLKLKEWRTIHRWFSHKGYKLLVKSMLNTKLKDTETGLKLFRKESILPILEEIKDKGWFWDTEIMIRSYHKGLKIKEVPVIFNRKSGINSKVRFFTDTLDYLIKLVKFTINMRLLKRIS